MTRVMTAELGGRLARCLSVPFLPLLAFPLGMAAKRRGRGAGLVIAAVLLLGFHHAIQFGESLGDAGRANAFLRCGFLRISCALQSWLFSQSLQRPGQNPPTRLRRHRRDGRPGSGHGAQEAALACETADDARPRPLPQQAVLHPHARRASAVLAILQILDLMEATDDLLPARGFGLDSSSKMWACGCPAWCSRSRRCG